MAWDEAAVFGIIGVVALLIVQSRLVQMKPDWVQKVYGYLVSWLGAILLVVVPRVIVLESSPTSVKTLDMLDTTFLVVIGLFSLMTLYFALQLWAGHLKKAGKPLREDYGTVRVPR